MSILSENRAAELARLSRLSFGDDLSFGHGVVTDNLELIATRQGHEKHTLWHLMQPVKDGPPGLEVGGPSFDC